MPAVLEQIEEAVQETGESVQELWESVDGRPFKLVLDVRPLKLTPEKFARLCAANHDLRLEKTAQEELIIMAPAFPETSRKNARIGTRLGVWAEQDDTGIYFESSGGFTLPNGAERSPDACWILRERY